MKHVKCDTKDSNHEGRRVKCRVFKLHLKLRDEQLKTIMRMHRLQYKSLMVASNQKSSIDVHTKKKKELKHNTEIVLKAQEKRKKKKGRRE